MKEKEIWKSTNETNSHLIYGKHIEKNINILNDLLSLANITKAEIYNVLDWGPGGGWLSKEVGGERLFLFDIVKKHEEIQRNNCQDKFDQIDFYDVAGEKYPDLDHKIDLAMVFSVFYHMPSLQYVKNAIEKLKSYKPTFIAVRNIFTDGKNWECDKFTNENILRMNIFNIDEFLSLFSDYEIVSESKKETTRKLHSIECYSKSFILKRR